MKNLKKVGLTALAGSLVAFSANAVEMSVSGTAEVTYTTTNGTTANTGNAWGSNTSLSFSGEGDVGFGTAKIVRTFNDNLGAALSTWQTLDMGDMGTLSMDTGSDLTGLPAYQDKVSNAGEQVWDDTGADHGTPAQGVVNPRADNTIEESLGYVVSMEGFTLSTHASFGDGNGTEYSGVIAATGLVDGLEIGAGLGNNWTSATAEDDLETYYIRYAAGPVTLGAQRSDVDKDAAASDIERTAYGISFAVNENLSISYGISDTDFESSASDEENEGISASYTAGGATIGFVHNQKDNAEGTANADHETTELKLTFAF